MRALCWLVPSGTELSRVCRGFGELRLSRADVGRLAEPPTLLAGLGSNVHKRQAVDAEIKRLGVPVLVTMSQKERELKIIEAVKERHAEDVSDRYVRGLFAEAKERS